MQILDWDNFIEAGLPPKVKATSITVGVFDGVHRGHKALIDSIVNHDRRSSPVVITFKQNNKKTAEILSLRQKLAIFQDMGVAVIIIAEISGSFKRLSGAEFISILQNKGKMRYMAIGRDFRCGHNQDTNAQVIQELNSEKNIPTDLIEEVTEDGLPISSSRIRAAILKGELGEAQAMLGRPFVFDVIGARKLESPHYNNEGFAYKVGSLERACLPTGRFTVSLYDKNGNTKRTEIHIEKGIIRTPAYPDLEFIEF